MIDLIPDENQQMLAQSFADVLAAEAPLERLRGQHHCDVPLVRRLAELGWIGLGVAEERGGLGLGTAEMALLMREAGRHLVSPRLLATMLAAEAADSELANSLLDGRRQASLAFAGPNTGYRLDHCNDDLTLLLSDEGAVLLEDVLDAQPVRAIDDTITLERVPLVLTVANKSLALRPTVLISAILVGMMEAARDMASSYAKLREQFGQPIGAFQAVKHRCADMALACEAAWSQTAFAALALDGQRQDARFQAAAARIVAGEGVLRCVRGNIQVHGGIGFTEEFDAQLIVRRAHVWLEASGGMRPHQMALLGQPAPARAA